MKDNLVRLGGLIGKRGLLPVRSMDGFSGEVPFTFVAVAPPRNVPQKTDFDTFNALISQSDFVVRFDDGTLLNGRNTRTVSGFCVLPDPKALVSAGLTNQKFCAALRAGEETRGLLYGKFYFCVAAPRGRVYSGGNGVEPLPNRFPASLT